MNVVLFGATGMVGQSVLRECLLDPDVQMVLSVGRSATGQRHPKLRELVLPDLFNLAPIESELSGFEACFFCLGVTSVGMNEESYRRITHELTLSVAQTLVRLNPAMTFVFISGAGADSTERSRTMWARVKGAAENAVLGLPFQAAYVIRPAVILPRHGIRSRTKLYQFFLTMFRPFYPIVKALLPRYVTTTEDLGRAMLRIAKHGAPKPVIESWDLGGGL